MYATLAGTPPTRPTAPPLNSTKHHTSQNPTSRRLGSRGPLGCRPPSLRAKLSPPGVRSSPTSRTRLSQDATLSIPMLRSRRLAPASSGAFALGKPSESQDRPSNETPTSTPHNTERLQFADRRGLPRPQTVGRHDSGDTTPAESLLEALRRCVRCDRESRARLQSRRNEPLELQA